MDEKQESETGSAGCAMKNPLCVHALGQQGRAAGGPGIQERPLRDGKFRVYRLAEQA